MPESRTLPVLSCLCHSPRVFVADDFISGGEADHILRLSADDAQRVAWGVVPKHDSTGLSFEMPIDGNAVLEAVRARVHAVVGLENLQPRTMRFRRYGRGESHPPHLDCFEIDDAHLVATALVNLVDCADGGETRFPRAWPEPLRVSPVRGRLVVWFNYYPNGARDESSYHEGDPVVDGEKVTLTAFIYRPLEDARHMPAVTAAAETDT